jgi:hypothetical protein
LKITEELLMLLYFTAASLAPNVPADLLLDWLEAAFALIMGPPQHINSLSTQSHALLITTSRPQSAQQNVSSFLTLAIVDVLLKIIVNEIFLITGKKVNGSLSGL